MPLSHQWLFWSLKSAPATAHDNLPSYLNFAMPESLTFIPWRFSLASGLIHGIWRPSAPETLSAWCVLPPPPFSDPFAQKILAMSQNCFYLVLMLPRHLEPQVG